MQEVYLREGELTWGLWAPVAAARLIQTVEGAIGGADAVQPTSEIVRSFGLLQFADAIMRDEAAERDRQTVERFEELAKRFGAKDNGKQ